MFEPQWTAFAGRARFIVPDLRGFGGSGLVPGPSEMGAMADDVLALMDQLGIDAAVVGGVSMGGYVTLALLRNDPSRVRALVLADTQTSPDDAAGRERRETTARRSLPRARPRSCPASTLLAPSAPDEVRARVAGGSSPALPRARRRHCRAWRSARTPATSSPGSGGAARGRRRTTS